MSDEVHVSDKHQELMAHGFRAHGFRFSGFRFSGSGLRVTNVKSLRLWVVFVISDLSGFRFSGFGSGGCQSSRHQSCPNYDFFAQEHFAWPQV